MYPAPGVGADTWGHHDESEACSPSTGREATGPGETLPASGLSVGTTVPVAAVCRLVPLTTKPVRFCRSGDPRNSATEEHR